MNNKGSVFYNAFKKKQQEPYPDNPNDPNEIFKFIETYYPLKGKPRISPLFGMYLMGNGLTMDLLALIFFTKEITHWDNLVKFITRGEYKKFDDIKKNLKSFLTLLLNYRFKIRIDESNIGEYKSGQFEYYFLKFNCISRDYALCFCFDKSDVSYRCYYNLLYKSESNNIYCSAKARIRHHHYHKIYKISYGKGMINYPNFYPDYKYYHGANVIQELDSAIQDFEYEIEKQTAEKLFLSGFENVGEKKGEGKNFCVLINQGVVFNHKEEEYENNENTVVSISLLNYLKDQFVEMKNNYYFDGFLPPSVIYDFYLKKGLITKEQIQEEIQKGYNQYEIYSILPNDYANPTEKNFVNSNAKNFFKKIESVNKIFEDLTLVKLINYNKVTDFGFMFNGKEALIQIFSNNSSFRGYIFSFLKKDLPSFEDFRFSYDIFEILIQKNIIDPKKKKTIKFA